MKFNIFSWLSELQEAYTSLEQSKLDSKPHAFRRVGEMNRAFVDKATLQTLTDIIDRAPKTSVSYTRTGNLVCYLKAARRQLDIRDEWDIPRVEISRVAVAEIGEAIEAIQDALFPKANIA